QHRVRAQHFTLRDRLDAIGRGADDVDPRQAAEMADRRGDEPGMVVDQQHFQSAHCFESQARNAMRWRARTGPMDSWSRYFATVRRAMRTPWRASSPAMTSSASGELAGSASMSCLTIARTAAP